MRSQTQSFALAAAALAALAEGNPVQPFSLNPRNMLAKRTVTSIACGLWPTADLNDNGRNYNNLDDKGDELVTVDGKACNRIGCYNTSGVYVCNDNEDEIELEMSEIMDYYGYMQRVCIGPNGMGKSRVSGQVFTDGNWNVNIAYCNGNLSPAMKPSEYGGWPGPDGEPDTICNWQDYPSCDLAEECVDDTAIVDEQTTTTCPDEEYLSASYIHAGASNLYSTTRSVTEGWIIGGSIGLDTSSLQKASANAGFSVSYIDTTTVGNNAGVSAPCGPTDDGEGSLGNFTCGLVLRPQCQHIKGTCEHPRGARIPFEVYAPSTAEDGIGNINHDICTCEKCPDADHPDAPDVCPMECNTECV